MIAILAIILVCFQFGTNYVDTEAAYFYCIWALPFGLAIHLLMTVLNSVIGYVLYLTVRTL